MITCILEKEDYEVLESLIKTSESIINIYKKLSSLEIKGLKDSLEYQKHLDYLKIAIEVENRLYSENDLNAFKCSALIKYIIDSKMQNGFVDDFDSLLHQNMRLPIIRRVYNSLNYIMYSDIQNMRRLSEIDLDDNEYIEDDDDYYDFLATEIIFDFQKEFSLIFLMISKQYQDILKKRFVQMKYYLASINKKVENWMLLNNYNIDDELFISSNILPQLNCLEMKDYQNIADSFAIKGTKKQILNILSFSDKDFINEKNMLNALIKSCGLRAYLLFLNPQTINEFQEMYQNMLNRKDYQDKIDTYYNAEKIIKKCFDYTNNDYKKIKLLNI